MSFEICNKDLCTGCSACFSVCANNAIQMIPNNKDFLYPSINEELCINCKRCVQTCPQNQSESINSGTENVYAALAVDDNIRNASSSGGLFSVIAEYILNNDGVVYGVRLTDALKAVHTRITSVDDLYLLRGSKYVQSDMNNQYSMVDEDLKNGVSVLFSGTPCQIAGLYAFLGKDYSNLFTVDLLCHGVPSPKIFKMYIENAELEKSSKVRSINFRKKIPGWSHYSVELNYQNGENESINMLSDTFISGFLKDYYLRESCYTCKYASASRVGDITLGDFWGYKESEPEYIQDDDRGISLVILNNTKAKQLFKKIKNKIALAPRTINQAKSGNKTLVSAFGKPEDYDDFWIDAYNMSWDDLANKYFPVIQNPGEYMSKRDRQFFAKPFTEQHKIHKAQVHKDLYCPELKHKKKYVLYEHFGSGNHGCEAIVRTTVALIKDKRDVVLSSFRPEMDFKYDIDSICDVVENGAKKEANKLSINYIKTYIMCKIKNDDSEIEELQKINAFGVKKGDIALSIGGDNYCYGYANDLKNRNEMFRTKGLKTVLWGCSIEPELLNDESIADDIKQFDLITARETISYEALKKVNQNTVLVADSAFILDKKNVNLPDDFKNCKLVGINCSLLSERSTNNPTLIRKNFENLISKIINETDMKILLIPHVVNESEPVENDFAVLNEIYNKFINTNKLLLIKDQSCENLKGYISNCRFFVGARTHATIAAYSTEVPTLVIGYSVKSRGIAIDLFGTSKHYVLPVQEIKTENDICNAFDWLQTNEQMIKDRLHKVLPDYISKVYCGVDALNKL